MLVVTTSPDQTLLDSTTAARLFKALGDPVRVELVGLVRRTEGQEACFCDLADQFDMPQSSLSHHLKILVNAGVLQRERRGTWSWYRVDNAAIDVSRSPRPSPLPDAAVSDLPLVRRNQRRGAPGAGRTDAGMT